MISYGYSFVKNNSTEEGRLLEQAQSFSYFSEEAQDIYARVGDMFSAKNDKWNAAWAYYLASSATLPNDRATQYSTLSAKAFEEVINNEKIDPKKRAFAAIIIQSILGFASASMKLGDSPLERDPRKLYSSAGSILEKVLPSKEPEKFEFLFRELTVHFSNHRVTLHEGLYSIYLRADEFKKAIDTAEPYLGRLYFDEKGWYYVSKSHICPEKAEVYLHEASENFLKDTYDNFEKVGKSFGKTRWMFTNESLWGNYFRGIELIVKALKKKNKHIKTLREALVFFRKSAGRHMHPPSQFYALLCETIANFLENQNVEEFEKAERQLTTLLGEYCKEDERMTHEIIKSINQGFKACIISPDSVSIENRNLKHAIELIDQISEWPLRGLLASSKKIIAEKARFLLTDNLSALENAVQEFEAFLTQGIIREEVLQKFLKEHPFLFGLEYMETKQKHRLGSEYVMDFALCTYHDMYHLVELERSDLKIYTKGGTPSSYLTHGEQQVQDWFIWIEENKAYAEQKLENITSPKGFVIIGRDSTLSENERKKLKMKNLLYGGKIEILTYDNLLKKARTILSSLKSLGR